MLPDLCFKSFAPATMMRIRLWVGKTEAGVGEVVSDDGDGDSPGDRRVWAGWGRHVGQVVGLELILTVEPMGFADGLSMGSRVEAGSRTKNTLKVWA